jgi:hypothetical protein
LDSKYEGAKDRFEYCEAKGTLWYVPDSSPQSSLLSLQVVQFQLLSQANDFEQQENGAFGGQQKRIQRRKAFLMSVGFSRSRSKRVSLGEAGKGKGAEDNSPTQYPLQTLANE